jgi:hypothetical protein
MPERAGMSQPRLQAGLANRQVFERMTRRSGKRVGVVGRDDLDVAIVIPHDYP